MRSSLGTLVTCISLFFGVLAVGSLAREETHYSAFRMRDALQVARQVADGCSGDVQSGTRAALITYLAIEDYFRPPYIREFEFLLASLGSHLGIRMVKTIGIGQISFETYLTVRSDYVHNNYVELLMQWISELKNDCKNVLVLAASLQKNGLVCAKDDIMCSLMCACFWHTGKSDNCLWEAKYEAYLKNVVKIYPKVVDETGYGEIKFQ